MRLVNFKSPPGRTSSKEGRTMIRPKTQARSRYLSLALQVRKALDSLVVFIEDGKEDPKFRYILSDVADSLRTTTGERSVFAHFHNQKSFGHYEQIHTMDEVRRKRGTDILNRISGVLDKSASPQKRRQDALQAIDFLYALESRALHQFNRPLRSGML